MLRPSHVNEESMEITPEMFAINCIIIVGCLPTMLLILPSHGYRSATPPDVRTVELRWAFVLTRYFPNFCRPSQYSIGNRDLTATVSSSSLNTSHSQSRLKAAINRTQLNPTLDATLETNTSKPPTPQQHGFPHPSYSHPLCRQRAAPRRRRDRPRLPYFFCETRGSLCCCCPRPRPQRRPRHRRDKATSPPLTLPHPFALVLPRLHLHETLP